MWEESAKSCPKMPRPTFGAFFRLPKSWSGSRVGPCLRDLIVALVHGVVQRGVAKLVNQPAGQRNWSTKPASAVKLVNELSINGLSHHVGCVSTRCMPTTPFEADRALFLNVSFTLASRIGTRAGHVATVWAWERDQFPCTASKSDFTRPRVGLIKSQRLASNFRWEHHALQQKERIFS